MKLALHESWNFLEEEFRKPYFLSIKERIVSDINSGIQIFPPLEKMFSVFEMVPFDDIQIVILGQDPYHGPGQAHGMSFSVQKNVKIPPSLRNIFIELEHDLGVPAPNHGNLESWANQGIFLLNAILSVQNGKPASHGQIGWEIFTDFVITQISERKETVIFVLWGNFARAKKALIDTSKHTILESPHPSPFSAYSGFFGSKPFSKINTILKSWGKSEIDWNIPE